jgi:hypothetical protein
MIEAMFFLVICLLGFIVYFLPTWVAFGRGAKNSAGILILNLFLGWMGLGWLIALIWSVCAECEEKKEVKKPNLFGGKSTGWDQ